MKQTKRLLALLLAMAFVFSLGIFGMSATAAEAVETLDIFSFNDFHGAVDKSASTSNPGADRFAAIVQELMSENPNSVLLAAGDLYQGSPLSNIFLGEPVSAMLEYLGVKYSAIGNHEFDWGADKINKFAEDGGVTFLAANIIETATGENPDFCQPFAIMELGTKTIGLIGYTTTMTPLIVKGEYVEGLEFRAPGDWLNVMIADLREQGCDLVIALTHTGGQQDSDGVITGEIADIAEACPDLDAIIGGHTHTLIAGTVNDIAIVVGNYNGRGLGRLTFEFDEDGAFTVTPVFYTQNNMNSDDILPSDPLQVDEAVTAIIERYSEEAGPEFATIVGVYGELIDSRETQAVWATQLIYDYILAETGESYIVLQNAGGLRDTAPYDKQATDDVTLGYLYTMMPFDNEIVLMDLSGDQLLTILNNTPDEAFVSAAVIIGAELDGEDWVLPDGEIISEDGTYKVATNDFMYSKGTGAGGDNFGPYLVGDNITIMGVSLRDAVIDVLLSRLDDEEILEEVESPDDWAVEEVAAAIALGLVPAYMQSNYTAATTRVEFAELAVIVYETIVGEITDFEVGVFTDTDSMFADKAASIGVVRGFEDGTFGPDLELTREQAATMLSRLAEAVGFPLDDAVMDFVDSELVQEYAVEAVGQVQAADIMRGVGESTFDPQGSYQRQQSILTILRLFNVVNADEGEDAEEGEDIDDNEDADNGEDTDTGEDSDDEEGAGEEGELDGEEEDGELDDESGEGDPDEDELDEAA